VFKVSDSLINYGKMCGEQRYIFHIFPQNFSLFFLDGFIYAYSVTKHCI